MMTQAEKIAYIQAVADDPTATDSVLIPYLMKAKSAIFARMYPWDNRPENVTEVPDRYELIQCDLAVRYFMRRGGEGEQIHNENGIHRHYGSVNDEDLLMEVMQVVRL